MTDQPERQDGQAGDKAAGDKAADVVVSGGLRLPPLTGKAG